MGGHHKAEGWATDWVGGCIAGSANLISGYPFDTVGARPWPSLSVSDSLGSGRAGLCWRNALISLSRLMYLQQPNIAPVEKGSSDQAEMLLWLYGHCRKGGTALTYSEKAAIWFYLWGGGGG